MGTPPFVLFFCHILRRKTPFIYFLFALLDNETLPRDQRLNTFLYELTLIEKEGKTENGTVASPKTVPILLNNVQGPIVQN